MSGAPKNSLSRPGGAMAKAFTLALLGRFEFGAAKISSKKNRALLAILALSPGGRATRERLCALLWGDKGEDQARSSLRQSLLVLRRELGEDAEHLLSTRDDVIEIKLDDMRIDAVAFLALAKTVEMEPLMRAAQLYRGELLVDLSLREAGFEEWLSSERRRFADQAIAVLEKLAAESGPERVDFAKRLVELDPLREASHRELMLAYLEVAENGLALRQYEFCRATLRKELDVEPTARTQELRNRIASAPATCTEQNSIAVLPFANLSADSDQQYFADGITEDLITALAKLPGFFVIARNSSFAYRGVDEAAADVARKLGVRYLVRGSVRREGGRIRINAHLADTVAGAVIWSDRIDRRAGDVFAAQDDVVAAIVGALPGQAPPLPQERYRSPSLEAYDL